MNHKDWDFVNRRLVAKMLSEMEYEQVFHAESQGDDPTALTCREHNGASSLNVVSGAGCGLMSKRCAARTNQYWRRRC